MKNTKRKKEKCLLCKKLTNTFWIVADDYDNLKPYHSTCRDKLVSMILKDAGMKTKTKKRNKTIFIKTQKEAEKQYRKEKREERKPYQRMTKTELIDKILDLEIDIRDFNAGASL